MESQPEEMKVSVVLPVYNCSGNLAPLFEEFVSEKPSDVQLELIWVNDGSTDSSLKELEQLESHLVDQNIITLSENVGSYRAVIKGLSSCTGQVVIVMAADGQDPPKVAFEMMDQLAGYELVAASKNQRSEAAPVSLFHNMMRSKIGANASKDPFDMVAFRAERIQGIVEDRKSSLHLFYYLDRLIRKKKVLYFDKRPRDFGASGWTLIKKIRLFVRCWLLF